MRREESRWDCEPRTRGPAGMKTWQRRGRNAGWNQPGCSLNERALWEHREAGSLGEGPGRQREAPCSACRGLGFHQTKTIVSASWDCSGEWRQTRGHRCNSSMDRRRLAWLRGAPWSRIFRYQPQTLRPSCHVLRNTLQNLSQHRPRMGLSFQLMMGHPQVSSPSWGCSDGDQTGAVCITSPTQMLGLW